MIHRFFFSLIVGNVRQPRPDLRLVVDRSLRFGLVLGFVSGRHWSLAFYGGFFFFCLIAVDWVRPSQINSDALPVLTTVESVGVVVVDDSAGAFWFSLGLLVDGLDDLHLVERILTYRMLTRQPEPDSKVSFKSSSLFWTIPPSTESFLRLQSLLSPLSPREVVRKTVMTTMLRAFPRSPTANLFLLSFQAI